MNYLLINTFSIFLAKRLNIFLVEYILLALIPFYLKLAIPPSKFDKFDNSVNIKKKILTRFASLALVYCLHTLGITVLNSVKPTIINLKIVLEF